MTENSQKKMPLVIDSTDSSASLEVASPSVTADSLSSDDSSSEDSSTIKSDEIGHDDELLETEYKDMNCDDEQFYSNKCNKFLLKKELLDRNYLSDHDDEYPALYPNLNDTNFNVKIAEKKEFNEPKICGLWCNYPVGGYG